MEVAQNGCFIMKNPTISYISCSSGATKLSVGTRQDAFAAIDSYLSKAQNQNNQNDLSIAHA